jgi:hypothetical protein
VTDRPDDLPGLADLPDTPGPEATPEQEAFVASLLGSLRADDPAMPEDVVRRLDAVLAQERLASAAAPAAAASLAPDADADAAPASLPDNVSVLPTRSERRGPSTRSFKLVTGIAAATVLVAGAAAVSSGVLGGGGGDASSGGAPVAAAVIQDSGTAYSSQSLDTQAERLVAKAYSAGDSGGELAPEATAQASPSTPDPRVTATGAATEPGTAPAPVPLTAEALDGCIDRITEGDGGDPLLVDQGSYDGRAAIVIVLPALDVERAVDVWVVTAPCDATTGDVVDFRRVDAP